MINLYPISLLHLNLYTEIQIKLGSELLNTLKTIPYDDSKNALSDLKVSSESPGQEKNSRKY